MVNQQHRTLNCTVIPSTSFKRWSSSTWLGIQGDVAASFQLTRHMTPEKNQTKVIPLSGIYGKDKKLQTGDLGRGVCVIPWKFPTHPDPMQSQSQFYHSTFILWGSDLYLWPNWAIGKTQRNNSKQHSCILDDLQFPCRKIIFGHSSGICAQCGSADVSPV